MASRNLAPLSVLATIAATSNPIGAQTLPQAFNIQDCPERTVHRWCASQARQDGWTVTHRNQSRQDLMDASWLYEIWRRDRDVMLCMYSGGRGGDRVNYCLPMSEVQ
jgi:uncharacterized protein YbdZ (MbtH family)